MFGQHCFLAPLSVSGVVLSVTFGTLWNNHSGRTKLHTIESSSTITCLIYMKDDQFLLTYVTYSTTYNA